MGGRMQRPVRDKPAPSWSVPRQSTGPRRGQGDALYDHASLTFGHQEHLGDVVAGYGTDVNLDVICAGWSLRARWLIEHGFNPSSPGCEFDVLRSQL